MNSGGAPMNAAASPPLRAMPQTGLFGWDWSNAGKRWRVKAGGSPCETRSARLPEDNLNRPQRATSTDALSATVFARKHEPRLHGEGSRGEVQACKNGREAVLSLLLG